MHLLAALRAREQGTHRAQRDLFRVESLPNSLPVQEAAAMPDPTGVPGSPTSPDPTVSPGSPSSPGERDSDELFAVDPNAPGDIVGDVTDALIHEEYAFREHFGQHCFVWFDDANFAQPGVPPCIARSRQEDRALSLQRFWELRALKIARARAARLAVLRS
ncbi:hypothetical protein T484DRAFT_1756812 [Baffinella frigidus]|nr:hypothetical protein T484DRAFT_1756812 [Cryptophyta sp. CCMP2293]